MRGQPAAGNAWAQPWSQGGGGASAGGTDVSADPMGAGSADPMALDAKKRSLLFEQLLAEILKRQHGQGLGGMPAPMGQGPRPPGQPGMGQPGMGGSSALMRLLQQGQPHGMPSPFGTGQG